MQVKCGTVNRSAITQLSTAFCQKPDNSENAVSGLNHAASDTVTMRQPSGCPRRNGPNKAKSNTTDQPIMTAPSMVLMKAEGLHFLGIFYTSFILPNSTISLCSASP